MVGIMVLKVKLDVGAYRPTRAYASDAGLDLYAREDKMIPSQGGAVFDTGVHVEIPEGYVGMLKSKSGLNVNHSISSEGVIDAGYTGSIRVKLLNHSGHPYPIHDGDKITQLVILPIKTPEVKLVEEIKDLGRGNNGFGSSGR